MHAMGLCLIVPVSVLLAVSFFVLFAVRKVETDVLKKFGFAVALLLWISAALVFLTGIAGHHRMCCRHCQGMWQHENRGGYGMERGGWAGKYEVGKDTCAFESMKGRAPDRWAGRHKKSEQPVK